jgi:hypothetical protein
MGRLTYWLVAGVAALAGAGVWAYRASQVNAAPPGPGAVAALVESAWTEGRSVPLQGRQETFTTGVDRAIDAEVVQSGDGQVRIKYLTEPLANVTVWENGDRTYRYNPRLKRLTVAKKRSSETPEEQGRLLLENYEPRAAGFATIAGRKATVVELRPRSGKGCWKRVWIDPQTKVILGSEDRKAEEGKPEGRIIRSSRFEQIDYLRSPPAPETFRPPAELVQKYGTALVGDTSPIFPVTDLSKILGFQIREPRWLPRGYAFLGASQTPCTCGERHQAARLEYGDGLNTISLFQCGHPACANTDNCFASGPETPGAFRYRRGKYFYLAIGDAPEKDLERMVRSAADL